MRRLLFSCCLVMAAIQSFGYTMSELFDLPEWTATNNWYCQQDTQERVRVNGLIVGPKETILWIELVPTVQRRRMTYWTSRQTYLEVGNKRLPFIGTRSNREDLLMWLTTEEGDAKDWGWNDVEPGKSYYYNLVFQGRFPFSELNNEDTISIVDGGYNGTRGYSLRGISVKAPFRGGFNLTEMHARRQLHKTKDAIEGIYESTDSECWRVYCRRQTKSSNGDYELLFLENGKHPCWEEGDLKAVLHPTATRGAFKADWTDESVHKDGSVVVVFDGAMMKVAGNEWPLDNGRSEMTFLKMYPKEMKATDSAEEKRGGGTGFALKSGYFVTNHHVIDGASDIRVWCEKNDVSKSSKATVVYKDKERDLALLKTDIYFTEIPYKIIPSDLDVGEEIFALGYPLVETMGKELKLTTGVISSASGFQGDRSNYQVSAAIQPGNSGGPLFNAKGELAGVVVAKHLMAENANYAIKSRVLRDMLIEHDMECYQPNGNTLFKPSIAGKVKRLREYVCRIECSYGGKLSDGGGGRRIEFPEVDKISHSAFDIVCVELNEDSTVIEFGSAEVGGGTWLHPQSELRANGHVYKMQKAVGVPTVHGDKSIGMDWVYRTFKAYFPALPKGVQSVDFVEPAPEEDGPFIFSGIKISDAK